MIRRPVDPDIYLQRAVAQAGPKLVEYKHTSGIMRLIDISLGAFGYVHGDVLFERCSLYGEEIFLGIGESFAGNICACLFSTKENGFRYYTNIDRTKLKEKSRSVENREEIRQVEIKPLYADLNV